MAINEIQVSRVLGTRYGGSVTISREDGSPSLQLVQYTRSLLCIEKDGLENTKEVTVAELIEVLRRQCSIPMLTAEEMMTKVAIVMLCTAVFFCPRESRTSIPLDAYKMVNDPYVLHKLNWGEYIVAEIFDGAKKVHHSVRTGKMVR